MSDRDSWCTPRRITKRLPIVDYDPCSNLRSTVQAKKRAILPENGLLKSWSGLTIGCNPPWSNPKPWAMKAWESDEFWFLVIDDSSTEWWSILTQFPTYRFSFRGRIGFVPPPGITPSTNDRPCTLICTPSYRMRIGEAFSGMGRWWKSD